jgi:hypothetical protein
LVAIIQKIGKRKWSVGAFRPNLRNPKSAVRVPEWELPQEDSIDDAEERCIRTNRLCQREHRCSEESWLFHQRAQTVMDVLPERTH